jgi:16S rRNA (adenine1518-N6/adenine1519-N6)-dimethyltransferase
MRPNELKALMEKYGSRPNKKLGQHFLCDELILSTIAAHVMGDRVLEIGPGTGALTRLLAANPTRRLVVWEKDPRFQDLLKDTLPQVEWNEGDALDIPWLDFAGFSVASNLPYNISVPLMLTYAQQAMGGFLGPAVLMMQKEVAMRVCAKVNTADYGRLSVMMQTFCTIEWVVNVPPSAFWPQPAVDSTVLKITPRTPSIQVSWDALSVTVEKAFARRRKMLHHNVSLTLEQWQHVDIDRTRRAETLSIEEFARLALLCQRPQACVP